VCQVERDLVGAYCMDAWMSNMPIKALTVAVGMALRAALGLEPPEVITCLFLVSQLLEDLPLVLQDVCTYRGVEKPEAEQKILAVIKASRGDILCPALVARLGRMLGDTQVGPFEPEQAEQGWTFWLLMHGRIAGVEARAQELAECTRTRCRPADWQDLQDDSVGDELFEGLATWELHA
jgi:hypothetical protein